MADIEEKLKEAVGAHDAGDLRHADRLYTALLAAAPNHPLLLHKAGILSQQLGRSAEAVRLLVRAIAAAPNDPEPYNHLGQVFVARDEIDFAERSFRKAIDVAPDYANAVNNLGNIFKLRGDLAGARAAYERALAIDPDFLLGWFNLAQILSLTEETAAAAEAYKAVLARDPAHVLARYHLAQCCEKLGKGDGARDHYRKAFDDGAYVPALAGLLALPDYAPTDAQLAAAKAAVADLATAENDQLKLHNALGRYFDRTAAYDAAFAAFSAAAAILKRRAPAFDHAATIRRTDELIAAFDAAYFPALAGETPLDTEGVTPVFIVGMPRSGTSLVEQILATYSEVLALGERPEMPRLRHAWRSAPERRAAADAYWRPARDRLTPETRVVTDKLPGNFLHLGAIASFFPGARIIHCRRNPLDVGLSTFIELFAEAENQTNDLEDFGRYYLEYHRLMRHWRAVLPCQIFDLDYEALAQDPERVAEALTGFCGLPWRPQCLDFHRSGRAVHTPSALQVRKPIYTTSIGRWRHYQAWLEPLRRMLSAAGLSLE